MKIILFIIAVTITVLSADTDGIIQKRWTSVPTEIYNEDKFYSAESEKKIQKSSNVNRVVSKNTPTELSPFIVNSSVEEVKSENSDESLKQYRYVKNSIDKADMDEAYERVLAILEDMGYRKNR